jgi:diguanylate cyclase (GGDEF)-like protein
MSHGRGMWSRPSAADQACMRLGATPRARPALLDALAAAGASGRAGLLVLVDVDQVREHNRLHGLAAGDALIAAVAQRLGDGAFHYLGDAFALLTLGTPQDVARAVAVRLDALSDDPALACSFGAAHTVADGPDAGAVLAAAERRLVDQQGRGPLPEDRILEALDPLVAAAHPAAHARAARAAALAPVIAGRLGVKAAGRERIRRCAAIGGDPELAPLHAQLHGLSTLRHTHAVLCALDAALRDDAPLAPGDLAVQAVAACIPGIDGTSGLEPRVAAAREAQLSAHELAPTLALPAPADDELDAAADPHAQRLAQLSRLHSLIDAAGHIDDPGDLDRSLQAVAQAISETLGFRNVVINLYRPEWDDYIVGTVFGADEVRDSLLGATYDWTMWEQVLDERFRHRGTYLVYAGEYDWSEQAGRRYVPADLDVVDDAGAWQVEDEVFVTFHQSDGKLGGILNVGSPVDGLRPSDAQLDTLVVVARHAARAVERAQAASASLQHRRGLEQLLAMSINLTRADDADGVLHAVVDGVADALGFATVSVHLADGDPGAPVRLAARNDRDRAALQPVLELPATLDDLAALMTPDAEVGGCFLLEHAEVCRRVPALGAVGSSRLNGRGPHAWTDHWLLVPLTAHDGATLGVVVADDPRDHLRPTTERMQALRLYANQAANALETLSQREQLRLLAERDPLTRLLNRRALMADLEEAVAEVQAEGRPTALAYCDLDGFKRLNDRHGHSAGDELLRTFAEILTDSIRPEDRAYRVGGDEFALLLCGCDEAEADRVVARVLDELARRSQIVGASFGVAVARTGGLDAARLLHSADSRMYESKRSVARSSA